LKTSIKLAILFLLTLFLEIMMVQPGWFDTLCPRFCFLLVLFIALKWGGKTGATAGFLIGMIYSGLFAEPPGLCSLSFCLTGYATGKVAGFLFDAPGVILFVFASVMFVGNDLIASSIMSIFYGPFFEVRFISALMGGIVFSVFYYRLEKWFRKKRM